MRMPGWVAFLHCESRSNTNTNARYQVLVYRTAGRHIFNSSILGSLISELPEYKHGHNNAHFDCPISAAANDLISNEVDAINLVRMSRQVCFELVRLQVPNLRMRR